MARAKTEILTKVKRELGVTDEAIWSTENLNEVIEDVVQEISKAEPLKARIPLPIAGRTRNIDLSDIVGPAELTISECEAAWTAKSNVTCTADPIVKHAVVSGFTTGLIATEDFTALNLSLYKKVRIRIRVSTAVASGVLQLCLDNTAACASPLETLDLPAMVANVWNEFTVSLVDPDDLTAVISVGLYAVSDPGTVNIYLEGITAIGTRQSRLIYPYLVEYPAGQYPPQKRNFERFGDILTLNISTVPTIVDGYVTGTLTFTNSSPTVTGSGTSFTTELSVDYFLRLYTGSRWYRIAYVESDTEITLTESFVDETATDTANRTLYRDNLSCAELQYGTEYLLTDFFSNLPAKMEDIVVLGAVAKAAVQRSGSHIETMAVSAMTAISTAETKVGEVAGRLELAIEDLSSGREALSGDLGSLTVELEAMALNIGDAITSLTTGDDLINKFNPGGRQAPQTWFEYARTYLQTGQSHIDRIKAYLQSAERAHDYIDYATGELNAGKSSLDQSATYINSIQQRYNVAQIARLYNTWADNKMALYRVALAGLGRVEDDFASQFPEE